MNNMMLMCCIKTISNLNCYAYCFFEWKLSTLLNVLLKSYSFYKFHYNIVYSVLITDIIYINYIRMCESCYRLRLCPEFRYKCLIFTKLRFHNLDSNKSVELMALCLINIRHTASTNLLNYFISVC